MASRIDGEPAALGSAQPGALLDQFGLHLLQPHVGDESFVVMLAVQGFGAGSDLDALREQGDFAL